MTKDGTVCDMPSPDSLTMPAVRPEDSRESTAWIAMGKAGLSKAKPDLRHMYAIRFGFKGAPNKSIGSFSGATRNSL